MGDRWIGAVCQAIYRGVEGTEWEHLCYKFVEMNKAVDVRSQGGICRAKMIWKVRDAKARGDAHYDQNSVYKIENRSEVRQELWDKHLQSPASALSEALWSVDDWEDAGSSTAGGSRN